jgi:hypothetical protein
MNRKNSNIRIAFFVLTAVLAVSAWIVQAEESGQNEQARPHFFQPGQGYEQEPEYKFSGVIRKLPASGMAGVWVIDDRLIVVSSMTNITEEKAKVAVGATIDVRGVLQRTDFVATKIEVTGSGKK